VRYHSRYLAFDSRDLLRYHGAKDSLFQKPTRAEQHLFDRYARFHGQPTCYTTTPQYKTYKCKGYVHTVEMTVNMSSGNRRLPLIAIGGYLQTSSQLVNQAEFSRMIPLSPNPSTPNVIAPSTVHVYPFGEVQKALISGHDPDPASHLVEDVNAEANIITALICHADGKHPSSVCTRPAIKSILKHVK
jgi:hypothetical protein